MDQGSVVGRFARLGARMAIYNAFHNTPVEGSGSGLAARSTDCVANPNLCEKPVDAGSLKVPIIIGVTIPVVLAAVFFVYLHRRSVARQRREDAIDMDKVEDYGMATRPGRKKGGLAEKSMGQKSMNHKNGQLSMDLDMSTPYLLPPSARGSRESLGSLARSLTNAEDPYRPVTSYGNHETASMRSWKLGNRNSMTSVRTGRSMPHGALRQNSLPKPAAAATTTTASNLQPQFGAATAYPPRDVHEPMSAQIEEVSYAVDSKSNHTSLLPAMPEIQEPEPAMSRTPRNAQAERPKWDNSSAPWSSSSSTTTAVNESAHAADDAPSLAPLAPKLELSLDSGPRSPEFDMSFDAAPSSTPPRESPRQFAAFPGPESSNASGSPFDDKHEAHPQFAIQAEDDDEDYYDDAYHARRRSLELHFEDTAQTQGPAGLSVPPGENRRLSVVGSRPLPPSDIGESDDPEYRANRIRSFYKEYFGDLGDEASRPPVPNLPATAPVHAAPRPAQGPPPGPGPQRGRQPGPVHPRRGPPPPPQGRGYPGGFGGDQFGGGPAPYYDPDHNTFVMPYAQPVMRRAMTPPPRFPGNGPRRNNHDSVGNMSGVSSLRPGSSVSNQHNNSRPGSRAGSSMSNVRGRHQGPKPRGPPPADLSTLPAPSKLMDDGLAILGTLDFAPPTTYAERARGRSQSPSGGERRPYKLNVPVHTPLAGSFDDLAAIPSPHMLRKSGTFTTLDFAPPRKFHDVSDNKSDAGSIRSNRSNVSKVNLAALRDQTHLPDDTIFSADDSSAKLRPQWGMRD